MPSLLKEFFRSVAAGIVSVLAAFLLLFGGGLLLLATAVNFAGSRPAAPVIPTVLCVDLAANFSDLPSSPPGPETTLPRLLTGDGRPVPLRTVVLALKKAAQDGKIAAIYLFGNIEQSGYASGPAAMRELRQALLEVRRAGKPIYAYNHAYSRRDYYLLSAADHLCLDPIGFIELNGLVVETMFYGEALRKYGVVVQTARTGKYKSAIEPMTRDRMSPESREQLQSLLDDLWGEYRQAVSETRGVSPETIQRIADEQGWLRGEEAVRAGLADKIAYQDQVFAELRALAPPKGDKPFEQIPVGDYVRRFLSSDDGRSVNEIAVLYAEGDILDGEGMEGRIGGRSLAREIRRLRARPEVKGLVLRLNTPGGSVMASEEIRREVELTKRSGKPVMVSMGSITASGGYWIASAANKIFASPNTITGSIGVFTILPSVEGLAAQVGVHWDRVRTARLADVSSATRAKDEAELHLFQANVERFYNIFLDRVAEARRRPRQEIEKLAEGRVWSGKAALQLGLVDALGGLEDAVESAAAAAGVGSQWVTREYPQRRSLAETLSKVLGERTPEPVSVHPVARSWRQIQAEARLLADLNDPLQVYARLPFSLTLP